MLSHAGRDAVLALAFHPRPPAFNPATIFHLMRLQLARRTHPMHRSITLTWQGRLLAHRISIRPGHIEALALVLATGRQAMEAAE